MKGYRFDEARRPIFLYSTGNEIAVEEQLVPVLASGGTRLKRTLTISAPANAAGVYFRAWAGSAIELNDGKYIAADGSEAETQVLTHGNRISLLLTDDRCVKGDYAGALLPYLNLSTRETQCFWLLVELALIKRAQQTNRSGVLRASLARLRVLHHLHHGHVGRGDAERRRSRFGAQ